MEVTVRIIGHLKKKKSFALGSCKGEGPYFSPVDSLANPPANFVPTLCPRHWPPPISGDSWVGLRSFLPTQAAQSCNLLQHRVTCEDSDAKAKDCQLLMAGSGLSPNPASEPVLQSVL